ncbi:MAG: sulfurtransferase [Rhodothermales bacterium]|nr:sulfurtransferase [Rhodothermales bacterium]MBO6779884.1 sulfurtransferase [Rhodothermales bacterium]
MAFQTIITPEQLLSERDPDWVVIDCRFSLNDPDAGQREYAEAHIPGAFYAHLNRDLSGRIVPGSTGRHPIPEAADFRALMGSWGARPGVQVVVYDHGPGAIAARLWWLFRHHGHASVAVLEGGYQAWIGAELPLSADAPAVHEGTYPERAPIARAATPAEFGGARLVDARSSERYRGDHEPIDSRAGHIPGAASRPFGDNLDDDWHFLPPDQLRERFEGLGPAADQIHYCGSGVTAAHNLLALEIAGLYGARLYVGSWSDWITDPEHPVATGDE